jgi:hypothetical protein
LAVKGKVTINGENVNLTEKEILAFQLINFAKNADDIGDFVKGFNAIMDRTDGKPIQEVHNLDAESSPKFKAFLEHEGGFMDLETLENQEGENPDDDEEVDESELSEDDESNQRG